MTWCSFRFSDCYVRSLDQMKPVDGVCIYMCGTFLLCFTVLMPVLRCAEHPPFAP
jgi:hypothetical protein